MYPTEDKMYVPGPPIKPELLTIDYVREHGVVVMVSEDGLSGLCQVTKGLVVSFCGVILTPEGKIQDFSPRPINRYVRYVEKHNMSEGNE